MGFEVIRYCADTPTRRTNARFVVLAIGPSLEFETGLTSPDYDALVSRVVYVTPGHNLANSLNQALQSELAERPAWSDLILIADTRCTPSLNPFAPLRANLMEGDRRIVVPRLIDDEGAEERDADEQESPCLTGVATLGVLATTWETMCHLGLFDERFDGHMAISDYSYEARMRGWSIWLEPRAVWQGPGENDADDPAMKRRDNIQFTMKRTRQQFDQLNEAILY